MGGSSLRKNPQAVLAALIWLAGLVVCVPATSAGDAHLDPILIEYHRYSSKLAERDPTPLVRLYGSGKLLIHFPHYMKRAGDYHTTLTQAEMDELMNTLRTSGFVGSEASETARRIASAQAQQRPLQNVFYRSETTLSYVVVHGQTPVVSMTLRNLQSDARKLGTAVLLSAAAAERQLLALTARAGLIRTSPSGELASTPSP